MELQDGEVRKMYARMTIFTAKPGMVDSVATKDLIKQWRELTVAQKKGGGKGGYLLVDRSANKVVSISMWETEALMKAGETAHRERIRKMNATPLAVPIATEHYEIVAQI